MRVEGSGFRVESLQGYLAHKKTHPKDPTAGLCLGAYGGPRGVAVSYERGTPVEVRTLRGPISILVPNLPGLFIIPANISCEYSVCPFIRPICTRFCFTMTSQIQVCSNFRRARVILINALFNKISHPFHMEGGLTHSGGQNLLH